MPESVPNSLPRRHDLDWLRVLAILVLHLFHTGMVFNSWGFHIKNPERLPSLDLPMAFLHAWRMPLLFFVSGLGSVLALRKRSIRGFLAERHNRLIVPLLFGMLVIVPPQIYCERVTNGAVFSSYFEFWKTIFALVPYPQGNTSWHHLWFVLYLFVYALLAAPLLAFLRTSTGGRWQSAFCALVGRGAYLWFLLVPVAVVQVSLCWRWPETHSLVNDWANFAFQGLFFVYGILIGTDSSVWDRIAAKRRISLGLGLAVLASLLVDDIVGAQGGYPYAIEYFLRSCLTWFWILAAAGYAKRYLSFRNRFVDYANEGIYPFYILHQTAIIVIGTPMLTWGLGAWPKLFLLLTTSFVVSCLLYALLIRPFAWVRPLFGMKQRTRAEAVLVERPAAPVLGRPLVE